jgi:thiopeptide-type bacteriocin biosynthesis protein
MATPHWRQTTITFPSAHPNEHGPGPHAGDQVAFEGLATIMTDAETSRLISSWFYVRKGSWRLRYLPTTEPPDATADGWLTGQLEQLKRDGLLRGIVSGIYEPEVHAFGGPRAMDTAHQLWHHDSRHMLTRRPGRAGHDREISVMLCATMMRAAGLDWYEQGDVWARVVDHRDPPTGGLAASLHHAAERLLTVDPISLTRNDWPLADHRTLFDAYTVAGAALRHLNETGDLHRGLRATLAHHVIFAWNRRSIPGAHQAALATAAKAAVFGSDPTTCGSGPEGDS